MDRVCQRARPYLYDIVEVLEQNNIPLEMALLPIVESAFLPFSYSHGRAAGLWQFIPSTGKLLGLKQNWWYDGRRDPYTSTRAAAKYLNSLNKMLKGDWLYSLAGYNAGPGNVIKAIKRNKKRGKATDYWNLRLPKETLSYVPKLLALKAIVQDPKKHGITLCSIPNKPALELVALNGQLDLSIAANLAHMSLDELHAINSGFNQWATPPNGPHHLLLPLDKVEIFKLAESALPKDQRVLWKRHKVKSGETLSHIAQKYRTTTKEIKRANKMSNSRLRAGKHILIPTSQKSHSAYSLSADQRQKKLLSKNRKGNKHFYTVKPGDSWWKIAKQHGVNHRTLAKWNGKSPLDTLSTGQKLVIWSNKQPSPLSSRKATTQKLRYPVRKGDSLYTIAQKFRVTVRDLMRWNRLNKKKYLQPGQQLVIYVDVTRQSSRL